MADVDYAIEIKINNKKEILELWKMDLQKAMQ